MKKWLSIVCLAAVFAFSGCGGEASVSSTQDPDSSAPSSAFGDSSSSSSNGAASSPDDDSSFVSSGSDLTSNSSDDGSGNEDPSTNVTLEFFSINDLHGKFKDTDSNCGVDEMTAYLRAQQKNNPNTVLLSAGDMWQGSSESNLTYGNIITDWMNDLDFAAMTLGNHEYDWGEEYIEQNAEIAEFPILGINVYDPDTNERETYAQPSVMIEKNGVQIGVIGAIGDCISSIASDKTADVYFKTDDALTELVKAESTRLREQGADVIVYSLHDSGSSNDSYYNEELSNGYVDLVFEGHSHAYVRRQDKYGVWHLQAGGDNKTGLSYAKLSVDLLSGDVTVLSASVVEHSEYLQLEDDPIVAELLEKYADVISKTDEFLGLNDSYRNSEALASYAAQATFELGYERWNNDENYTGKIVLGGGFLNVRSPYSLNAGKVTYGDIYPLFPFDNPIILCRVNGARLLRQFINSTNYTCFYGEEGQAIKNNLQLNETYYVVVDTYTANFNFQGMGYLEIVEYYDEENPLYTRDALAQFIKDGGLSASSADGTSTIPEILAVGKQLAVGAETAEKYRTVGTIIDIDNKKYGNMTIQDADGNTLYVYRTYDINGILYNSMSNQPQVGDVVTLEAIIKNYNGQIEFFNATVLEIAGSSSDEAPSELSTLTLGSGFGGNDISSYATGNYGDYTVNGVTFEYYRAYKNSSVVAATLLPYFSSADEGTLPGMLYNVSPIYGIESVSITYKSGDTAALYTGDDRVASMTAYALPKADSFTTKTFDVDADNFFKLESGDTVLEIESITIEYTNQSVSYNTQKTLSGTDDFRLNAVTFQGTLVAGQSSVSVPVKVEYDGGRYAITQTKTYTYYTVAYVEAHPEIASKAAMTEPADIAAYYTAFKQFPANFAAKTKNLQSVCSDFASLQKIFGDDTRYVSKYDRISGYAQYVPYNSSNTVYYEFDVALDPSYWEENERGVGRVVAWEAGWVGDEYDSSPVCVYTDDHYASFQEYLNTGDFGKRFDAEMDLTFVKWSEPDTVSAS